jgi:hypothetical protein
MNRIITIVTLALLAASTVRGEGLTLKKEGDKVLYDTYIWKADSLNWPARKKHLPSN